MNRSGEAMRTIWAWAIVLTLALGATRALAHDGPIAETPPDERDLWISLGARIHGGFGSLIAVGIRIGDDARQRLRAMPRELDVTYYSGRAAPCPCVVDGVMIATQTSPGQRSLRVSEMPADDGQFGRLVIRNKQSGQALEYVIPQASAAKLLAANRGTQIERWNAIMNLPEEEVFARREIAPASSGSGKEK
jgi:formylmethanofuran dehydrogenase subunit E